MSLQIHQVIRVAGRVGVEVRDHPNVMASCPFEPVHRFVHPNLRGQAHARAPRRQSGEVQHMRLPSVLAVGRSPTSTGNIFVTMALRYFSEAEVYERLHALNNGEGTIMRGLPLRAALH